MSFVFALLHPPPLAPLMMSLTEGFSTCTSEPWSPKALLLDAVRALIEERAVSAAK